MKEKKALVLTDQKEIEQNRLEAFCQGIEYAALILRCSKHEHMTFSDYWFDHTLQNHATKLRCWKELPNWQNCTKNPVRLSRTKKWIIRLLNRLP